MINFAEIAQNVIAGQGERVKELTRSAIDNGAEPLAIINEGLIAGMTVVGARFKAGQMYVPEVLMAAKAWVRAWNWSNPCWWGKRCLPPGR